MRNLEIKNIKSHPSLSLAKANASRDLQINFNQAEDALTIPTESRHDHKCGFATQRGRSMIEMLGVLAIIGVLSVGGIAGYSKAMMKYRINKTIEQITLIAGNVRAFWGPQKNYIGVGCGYCDGSSCYGHSGVDANGRPTYADNGCPVVKKAKIFPDEMIAVTDGKIMSITNPFGGWVLLWEENKAKSGDYKSFVLDFMGISQEACLELVTHDWQSSGITIVGTIGSGNVEKYAKTPVDLEKAIELCYENDIEVLYIYDADVNSSYWKGWF